METCMLFKELVREIRIKCNISQKILAEWSNIDQVSISYYERGSRKPGLLAKNKMIKVANEKAGMNVKDSDIDD